MKRKKEKKNEKKKNEKWKNEKNTRPDMQAKDESKQAPVCRSPSTTHENPHLKTWHNT